MRKVADCREMPSDSRCSLLISGEEEEVVRAAVQHAADVHGHQDTPEFREQIRKSLEDEAPAGRYGTVMIAKLIGSAQELERATTEWARERNVKGFLAEETLVADDGQTIVSAAFFTNRKDYETLADDPEQDRWWQERMAPNLTDVRWIDGTFQAGVVRQAPRSKQSA